MGPTEIKQYIYNVMTSSRELTNYCQESVKSFKSKKISDALNNFHLKTSIDFVTNSLTKDDKSFLEFNEVVFDNAIELEDKPIYIKVIDFIETYILASNM